jgi:hypothetical protein
MHYVLNLIQLQLLIDEQKHCCSYPKLSSENDSTDATILYLWIDKVATMYKLLIFYRFNWILHEQNLVGWGRYGVARWTKNQVSSPTGMLSNWQRSWILVFTITKQRELSRYLYQSWPLYKLTCRMIIILTALYNSMPSIIEFILPPTNLSISLDFFSCSICSTISVTPG